MGKWISGLIEREGEGGMIKKQKRDNLKNRKS